MRNLTYFGMILKFSIRVSLFNHLSPLQLRTCSNFLFYSPEHKHKNLSIDVKAEYKTNH